MAEAFVVIQTEVVRSAHRTEQNQRDEVDIQRGDQYQRRGADVGPGDHREGAGDGGQAGSDHRDHDERHRGSALGHRARASSHEHGRQRVFGRAFDQNPEALSGHLFEVAADELDADKKKPQAGKNGPENFHAELPPQKRS